MKRTKGQQMHPLGFIILIMLYGCSANTASHSLTDRDNKTHKYYIDNDTFYIIEPKNYYCVEHYRWEKIYLIRSVDGIKYIVR